MIHHDLEPLPRCELDELLRLLRRRSEGLLDKDVLTILQGRFRQLEVGPGRGDDGDGIHLRRRQQLRAVSCQLHAGIGLSCALETPGVLIADGYKIAVFETMEIPDDVRTPIAIADDTEM